MVKITKLKKEKPVITTALEKTVEQPVITEPVKELPKVVDIPPPVTLDEVKVPDKIKISPVELLDIDKVKDFAKKWHPDLTTEKEDDLTIEQKVVKFVSDKTGLIRLNEFLKSVYNPVPTFNQTPMDVVTLRNISGVIENIRNTGLFEVVNDTHKQLGKTFYPDSKTMIAKNYDLNDIIITVKK